MDESYGHYAIGFYGHPAPVSSHVHTHVSDSSSRGAHHSRYRRGGATQQPQLTGRNSFAESRAVSGTRAGRGTTTTTSSSSPGRQRSPNRERLGGTGSASARGATGFRVDPRLGAAAQRDERTGGNSGGRGIVHHDIAGRNYPDESSDPDVLFHNCREAVEDFGPGTRSGAGRRERVENPYRGDRPRWAVAESHVAINGGQRTQAGPNVGNVDEDDSQVRDLWKREQLAAVHPEPVRLPNFSSLSMHGRGGAGRFGGGGAEGSSSGNPQQGRGGALYDTGSASTHGTGRTRSAVDASGFHNFPGDGPHDGRGNSHRRRGGGGGGAHGLVALSNNSRREWCPVGVSRAEFGSESRPGSSSGDSVTSRENMGRPFSHEGGAGRSGRREFGSGPSRGGHRRGRDGYGVDLPSPLRLREESDSAGALWKAKKSQVPQLVQELEEKLTRGTVECMICYDMVGRGSPVWSCASCFAIFHLSCIKRWARAPTSADLSISSSSTLHLDENWRCPGCQTVEFVSAKDLRYYCFCGQVETPAVDHYLTPHSCGGPCKKTLDKSKTKRCNHYCTMQCHPGPCPPCAANAPSESCPCGKTTFTRRCGEQKAVGSCGDVCGRLLLCGRHSCSRLCHEGPCESCKVEVTTQCFCGVKQEILSCGRVEIQGELDFEKGLFSCASPCSKLLSCGNHKCKEKCHPGQCGECELAPSKLRTCPCGKRKLRKLEDIVSAGRGARKSCLDAIPTCSQGCGKLLPCAVHMCRELCHGGPCPPCKVFVDQKCRCLSTTRSVPCYVSQGAEIVGEEKVDGALFLCEKQCGQKKNCGKHRCNTRCCPALRDANHGRNPDECGPHECMLACGKKLRCTQHFCQELCHSGHCPPCLESIFTELSCACGKTSIPPPVACGTPLPACQQQCSFTQACGHSPTHLCHFGDCPPCTVPVSKECVGNHVILRGVPCGSRDIKCNTLCGKTRQCGVHACGRPCHVGPCDAPPSSMADQLDRGTMATTIANASANANAKPAVKVSCGQQCGAPRRDCPHICVAACHPSSQCPDNRCKVTVTIKCGCGRLYGEVPCDAGGSSYSRASAETEMVLSRLPAPLQPINNNEKAAIGQRKLQCDDECGKLEKRRLLADAFGVDFQGGDGDNGGLGSDLLAEMLRRDPQWVLSVEERFKTLLLGPKGTPAGGLKVHVFCTMPKDKRNIIAQLAARWSLSICNAGREPSRFPIVHVTNKSKVPYLKLLSKAQLPTAGQQVPPAFNSAVDMDPGRVVAFFDVPREVDMSGLVLRFAGECELVWLNDKNALAIFGDPTRAATALRRVDHTSAYKGAISVPGSAIHAASGRRSGAAWGQAPDPYGSSSSNKPVPRKKALQRESPVWVDDAWGDESGWISSTGSKKAVTLGGANLQTKGANHPITTTKNPWGALEQSRAKFNEAERKGCFVSSQPSSSSGGARGKEADGSDSSNAQGERAKTSIGTSSVITDVTDKHQSSATGDPDSRPSVVAASSAANSDDDDWEKLLD